MRTILTVGWVLLVLGTASARCHGVPPGAPVDQWAGALTTGGRFHWCIQSQLPGMVAAPYREFLYGTATCHGRGCGQHRGAARATLTAEDPTATAPVGPLDLVLDWGRCVLVATYPARDAGLLTATLTCPGRPPRTVALVNARALAAGGQ